MYSVFKLLQKFFLRSHKQLQPCIVNHTVTCPCKVQAQKTFHTAVGGHHSLWNRGGHEFPKVPRQYFCDPPI